MRREIMLAFISFLLVIIGSLNWFCIGILQDEFVAGLFGSQSNVFSRLVYTLVGIASIIVAVNLIKNKGKFVVSFKKANKEYNAYMEDKKEDVKRRVCHSQCGAVHRRNPCFALHQRSTVRHQPTCQGQ